MPPLRSRDITPTMQKPSSLADLSPPPSVFAFLEPVSSLARRQNLILSIPATYGGLNAGPSPGTVVGIVLGTVAGIVLILLVVYSIFGLDGNGSITRRSASPPRRRRTAEIVDISSSRPRSRRDAIIVEEDMTPSQDDNVVEVIEELSDVSHVSPPPPRRAHSGRTSGSYRPDPLAYGSDREYDY